MSVYFTLKILLLTVQLQSTTKKRYFEDFLKNIKESSITAIYWYLVKIFHIFLDFFHLMKVCKKVAFVLVNLNLKVLMLNAKKKARKAIILFLRFQINVKHYYLKKKHPALNGAYRFFK